MMHTFILLDVLREPLEAIPVTHLPDNAAHEDLKGPHICIREDHLPLASGKVGEAKVVAELILGCSIRYINLIAKDKERDIHEGII